jgi:hypothetical protein
MLTAKKQLVAFGLLLLVALPLVLSVGLLIKQKIVHFKREQRFGTELSKTVIISIEKQYWTKQEKEIMIDGKLFDVESIKKVGNTLELTGFFDQKEDKIVNHIKVIEQQKDNSNSPLNYLTVKFLFLPNFKEFTAFSIQNNWRIITRQFSLYAESLSNMAYPAVVPPPKYC